MKSLLKITLGSLLLGSLTMSGQISDECKKDASLGMESAKAKNYAEAEPYLLKVRQNCPTYSLATYQYSEKILRDKLKKAPASGKQAIVNDLIALFKERQQHFASKTPSGDVYSDIAQLKTDNNMGTKLEQYEMYKKAYQDEANFKGPKKIYTYFSHAVDLQADGTINIQEVFSLYDDLTAKIEVEEGRMATKIAKYTEKEESGASLLSKEKKSLDKAEKSLKVYSQVKSSVDKKLGVLADCKYLIPMFTTEFSAKQNDLAWVKSSARRMYKKDCTEDPLFLKLVEKQHQLEPSASTAKYLAKLADQRGDNAGANKYYEQSIELETDPSEKADAYYKLALSLKSKKNYGKARSYFRKALQFKPGLGAAYLQIASMIANSANSCGSDEFNKRAVYWLAERYANKAARVDPSVKSNASKAAASYKGRAPSKTDVFTKGMQGKTISIGCWIGESVKVPN